MLLLQTTLKHWILQQSFHKWHAQGADTRQTEMGKRAVNPFTVLNRDSLHVGQLGLAAEEGCSASCLIDLTTAPPSGSPKSTTLKRLHRGRRPKLHMSKEVDTDNSHNHCSHMLGHLECTKRFQTFK